MTKPLEVPAELANAGAFQKMQSLLEIQGSEGNWDANEYMRGMYNGMELMVAVAEGREPVYKESPFAGKQPVELGDPRD